MNTELKAHDSAAKTRQSAKNIKHKSESKTKQQAQHQTNRQAVYWFKFVACIWCLLFITLTVEANEQEQTQAKTHSPSDETTTSLADQLSIAQQPSKQRQIKVVADYTRELNSSNHETSSTHQLSLKANQQLKETPLLPLSNRMTRIEHQAAKLAAQANSELPVSKQKIQIKAARSFRQEFGIFDAVSRLFDDIDADGFYRTFSITFDADVYTYNGVNEALVYADIYLSQNGGDWEYFYSTDNFMIFGESTNDQYEVLSTLASGYQTAHYDVLIDLYQVGYSNIVATYSSDDNSSLYALPLESENYDIYYEEEIDEHGGSFVWLSLAIIARLLWRRR